MQFSQKGTNKFGFLGFSKIFIHFLVFSMLFLIFLIFLECSRKFEKIKKIKKNTWKFRKMLENPRKFKNSQFSKRITIKIIVFSNSAPSQQTVHRGTGSRTNSRTQMLQRGQVVACSTSLCQCNCWSHAGMSALNFILITF